MRIHSKLCALTIINEKYTHIMAYMTIGQDVDVVKECQITKNTKI